LKTGSAVASPEQFMSRRFLYSRLGSAVIVTVAVLAAMALRSEAQQRPQLKRPQETPEETPAETKKAKKVKGPRAVGVLQLSNGKATLIPVAILVDGKFHDASAYKADPVPMALETGTVYEAEQGGESQGLFTTNGALHSKAAGSLNPWLGTGAYLPHGTDAPRTRRKAEDVPVGMDAGGDEPPRLSRNPAPASSSSASPTTSGEKESSEKPGGEVAASKTADQGEKKQSPPSGKTSPAQPLPAQSSPGKASQSQTSPTAASDTYYRPTLRRGKPTQAAPEEEDPTPKAGDAGAPPSTPISGAKPLQVMPAISDSGGPDPQSYKFFWKEGEEEERRKQMLTLAGEELRAYMNARAKAAIGAKPAASKAEAPRGKAGMKPAPIFENIQFRAFDVWKSNQPVMILSADAHLPAATSGTGTAPETYQITLVSRTDIYGSLRKLYSGVTDKFHLDVTPRLELIDAVDADGDGRGELLFRETTDAGNGYLIYRATGDRLWKMFDSLGGE
jgi:hypothetical protein